jgi:maltooligosyltrehalose trehalohydrolase
MGDGTTLSLIANLSDRDASHEDHETGGTLIWGTALTQSVPPWSVFWRIG